MFEETPMSRILKEKFPSWKLVPKSELDSFSKKVFIKHLKEEIDISLDQRNKSEFMRLTSLLISL